MAAANNNNASLPSSPAPSPAAPRRRQPRADGAAGAAAADKPKRPSLGERFESLSNDLHDFRRTGRYIKTDGGDVYGSASVAIRALFGIKYDSFKKYLDKGAYWTHSIAVVKNQPLVFAGQETSGLLCLPLNEVVLTEIGIDTAKMAPEDFVVPLRVVRAGDVIDHNTLADFERFTAKWVQSLVRSLHRPNAASLPMVRAILERTVPAEELMVELNFPWKSPE